VLPLLISDLPAFCRWRGEPDWRSGALRELTSVCDRLIVDSAEWRQPVASYPRLVRLLDRLAVSDLAWRRGLPWRRSLADRWPGIRGVERLRVEGPRADAVLLAGWLRARLRRDVRLTVHRAEQLQAVWVDGDPVGPPPGKASTSSELLSAELDTLGRDPVYEQALRALARR
jgi:glucose-6-phosphate dehydrogenase assembly protein OpcA